MLSVVCYRWQPMPGYRSTFGPETVNVLFRMVKRHYQKPFRFIAVTDDPSGLDTDVEVVPMWDDFARVPSPHGGRNPSCYRRLKAFAPEIADVFGPRFVTIDLDTVITGDLSPIFDAPEDFRIWGDTNPRTWYNGSLVLMNAGARPKVWTDFDPIKSPTKAKDALCFGSDQGWISYCLGPNEAKWSTQDGVYSFRVHLKGGKKPLPENARIVNFHGMVDPSSPQAQQLDWVKRWYR